MFKGHNNFVLTFTKKWVGRLLWFGVVWITASYILAFMGKEQIAETLSSNVVTVIIATILGYLLKAFFETYCEKRNELKRELNIGNNNQEKEED